MESEKNIIIGIVDHLVENGVVAAKEAQAMIQNFEKQSEVSFDYFVVSEGLVSKEDLLLALSQYYQVPAMDVRGYFFDTGLVRSIPKDFLLHYGVIPLEVEEDIMTVVAYRPDLPDLDSKLAEYGSYVIEFRVGLLRDIIDVVREYYDEEVITTNDMSSDDAIELIEEDDIDQLPDESI